MSIISFIFSVIYTSMGVAGFVTFSVLKNYPSAVWAVCTGLVSAVCAHINWLSYRRKLDDWYGSNELSSMYYGGFATFAIGTSGLVYHMTMEILAKQPVLPVNQSYVLPAIWALLTLKSGLVLMCSSNRRSSESTPLLDYGAGTSSSSRSYGNP